MPEGPRGQALPQNPRGRAPNGQQRTPTSLSSPRHLEGVLTRHHALRADPAPTGGHLPWLAGRASSRLSLPHPFPPSLQKSPNATPSTHLTWTRGVLQGFLRTRSYFGTEC